MNKLLSGNMIFFSVDRIESYPKFGDHESMLYKIS